MLLRFFAALVLLAIPVAAGAEPAHYLVLHEDASGRVTVAFSAQVEARGVSRLAPTVAGNGQGGRNERRLSVQAMRGDAVVFATDVAAVDERRYEFARAGGGIDGRHVPLREFYYVLRVPGSVGADRALVFRPGPSKSGGALAEIRLDPPLAREKAAADVFPVITNGDPANRIDILVLGDGYTADQRAKFVQDASDVAGRFFLLSPYAEYAPMFNVVGLFIASAQSGASKPQCPETPTAPVIVVDTALKAHYCAGGIRRAIDVDPQLTFAAASGYPDWDEVMVIVNDTEYGGSGGAWAVTSLDPLATAIVQHEFGHSFTRLADEYETATPGFRSCTDVPGTGNVPCEPNVTDVLSPLKWQGFVDPATPIPTVNIQPDPRAAGAWQGARYQASGMYRQCYDGRMRDLAQPFCEVDSAAFVARVFNGGWGVPSAGISLLEPGGTSPAASTSAPAGTSVPMRARVAAPANGVHAKWTLDGAVVKEETVGKGGAASYDLVLAAGAHAVTLEVTDLNVFELAPHRNAFSWTVQASAPPQAALAIARTGTGSGRALSDPAGIDCGNACTASFAAGAVVRLTATADAGSRFDGWSGPCTGTGSCALTLNGSVTVGASFSLLPPPAVASVKPASLDFGGQSMHTTSPAQLVTLSNTGGSPLDLSSIVASAGFAVSHACGTLAPGNACTASVTFTPLAEGALGGTLDIATSAGAVSVPLAGTGERSLVTHYYRSILRRDPDAGGKAFWTAEADRMRLLGANANEAWFAMAAQFFASAEYQGLARDDAGYLQDLYATFFNRAADAAGLDFWLSRLGAGLPRGAVLGAFTFSPEFADFTAGIFGSIAVRPEIDTVTDFYRGLLGRLPDSGGLVFWRDRFRAAQCAGAGAVSAEAEAISSAFANGAEYAARARDDSRFVSDLYDAFLRRGADVGGERFWADQLARGLQSRDDVRRAFVASSEFQQRVGRIVQAGCLR